MVVSFNAEVCLYYFFILSRQIILSPNVTCSHVAHLSAAVKQENYQKHSRRLTSNLDNLDNLLQLVILLVDLFDSCFYIFVFIVL